jgi:hypothetical protein
MTLRIITFGTLCVRRDRSTLAGAAAQPRRLALLATLARAGDRGVTREKLTALVWPDSDEERARRAITQSIYALRQELGFDETIVGVKDLRLNPELITSDVAEFTAAVRAGRSEDAVSVYAGPFLDGFHLTGTDEFDRRADAERSVLLQGTSRHSKAGRRRGHSWRPHCRHWLVRRLSAKDPLSASLCDRRYAIADGDGDSTGTRARARTTLLEEQLDLPADRDVVALAPASDASCVPVLAPRRSCRPRRPPWPSMSRSSRSRPAPSTPIATWPSCLTTCRRSLRSSGRPTHRRRGASKPADHGSCGGAGDAVLDRGAPRSHPLEAIGLAAAGIATLPLVRWSSAVA